jgi:cytochrome o ubiquinol oxidase subunit 1
MHILGKLTLDAIPYTNPIIMAASVFMALVVCAGLFPLFYYKKWTWFWKEYLTTVDHKKIGIMYVFVAGLMLLRGFTDAILMRTQQVMSVGANHGFLPPEHYDQIFSAHGVIMIFFMAMPFMFGLFNMVVPLQIGARDVAFPFLNSLSFWLFAVGTLLVNICLVVGDFAGTGWLAYPPLSEVAYSPGVGVDYYIWSLEISGMGSLFSGINFFVTILKMRCPGMTLMRIPVFTWSVLAASILIIIAFPILTVTLALLLFDRYFDMHFFTTDLGGNAMMYINMIWAWGHPEVYILILPAFGIFSEVVATFCKKKLFGYTTMVWAIGVIAILSFIVWLHHFFTMGAGPDVNAVFGITTMIIAIPTGVKIFNWLFTMFRGRIHFTTPILWTLGFLITFSIGGMTGVLMSVPAADFQLHNSLFLIAHFHNVIIGGVVFGYLAGLTYWFPKAFGFKLNERLGKCAFWCWIVGFYLSFMPLYILGFMGMTRRLYHYETSTGWHPYLVVAAIGVAVILCGVGFQVLQIVVSVKNRHLPEYKDTSGDPWDARTLEWSLPSPPAFYNFAHIPQVNDLDGFWEEKQAKLNHPQTQEKKVYEDIHMPRNSMLPFLFAIVVFLFGFAFIWDIQWLIILGVMGILALVLVRSFDYDIDYYVSAREVEETERSLGR